MTTPDSPSDSSPSGSSPGLPAGLPAGLPPGGDVPDDEHTRPDGVDDATVSALGKISEALEAVEVARGHLYAFHRLSGTADLTLGDGVDELREAGHDELADRLERELVGRNVLQGRWTFQIMEEYDDGYYATFRALEKQSREELVGGRRHLYEAEMKEDRRSHGDPAHTARPDDSQGATAGRGADEADTPGTGSRA